MRASDGKADDRPQQDLSWSRRRPLRTTFRFACRHAARRVYGSLKRQTHFGVKFRTDVLAADTAGRIDDLSHSAKFLRNGPVAVIGRLRQIDCTRKKNLRRVGMLETTVGRIRDFGAELTRGAWDLLARRARGILLNGGIVDRGRALRCSIPFACLFLGD